MFLVTGLRPKPLSTPIHSIYDTEPEAKAFGEKCLEEGAAEIAVWKQVAAPTVEKKVTWA